VYNAILQFLFSVLILFILFVSFFGLSRVEGASMYPTLKDGEHMLVSRHSASLVQRGNIVTLNAPNINPPLTQIDPDTGEEVPVRFLVKRVAALPGDTIKFEMGPITPNGTSVHFYLKERGTDRFILQNDICSFSANMTYNGHRFTFINRGDNGFGKEIVVPPNSIFVMGDNRDRSHDSRYYGFQAIRDITGRQTLLLKQGGFFERLLLFIY